MENKKISNTALFFRGQLTVNLPVTIIIFCTTYISIMFLDFNFRPSIFIGIVFAWVYWAFAVKSWIKWAVSNGVDEARLLKVGKLGLLVWSKNTIETVTKKNKTPFI
jgi:hypothetical protein